MKTKVIMERSMMGLPVRQDSKTEMFNANDMHNIGNEHRVNLGLGKKQLASYFDLDSTKELINAVCMEDNIQSEDVKISRRGKNGGTWVHPVLFVDLVMWYSPKLKAKIIKWVIDGLLSARNNSGDSFKEANKVLTKYFPKEFESPIAYMQAANQVANACKVGTGKDKWQKASEDQLILRDKIQDNICLLADVTPNAGTCINKAISKAMIYVRKLKEVA
tara:strand:+ start:41 stop:697 length:657 start_codon:yes stop_codon:yes gene_type:complete